MSRYVSIKLEFNNELSIPELVGSLTRSGWRLDDGGHINYLVESDMTDWDTKPLDAAPAVIEEMDRAREAHGACAMILTWGATGIGGSFLVLSGGQKLMLDPRVDTVYREDAGDYVDFEWYLAKILPVVSGLGLTGYTVADLPS
ncbi:hypothetical protein FNV62_41480 [Streptomyces sp. RLB3-17]|uniref:hypothetical protein n=1 Tax=unclassified Streptomyces TaxID=2593676 RepID=UPI0011622B92|nr:MULTISPECIES: hypothetical protein [unclassified Streptomyces]QDN81511.1 hypothetical protein FNV64_43510 [Streptomyces sp. S1A1-7]QDO43715.1 hypothetical protein FNV62_41480 [Streptomyces sp. RLB3-17]